MDKNDELLEKSKNYYKAITEQYENLIMLKKQYDNKKPKLMWTEKNTDKLTMSGFECCINSSFEELVKLFGWPCIDCSFTDSSIKSMVEWCLTIPGKNITFSIYNYKDHLEYSASYGKSIIDITEWHVRCHDRNIKEYLDEVLCNIISESSSFRICIISDWKKF